MKLASFSPLSRRIFDTSSLLVAKKPSVQQSRSQDLASQQQQDINDNDTKRNNNLTDFTLIKEFNIPGLGRIIPALEDLPDPSLLSRYTYTQSYQYSCDNLPYDFETKETCDLYYFQNAPCDDLWNLFRNDTTMACENCVPSYYQRSNESGKVEKLRNATGGKLTDAYGNMLLDGEKTVLYWENILQNKEGDGRPRIVQDNALHHTLGWFNYIFWDLGYTMEDLRQAEREGMNSKGGITMKNNFCQQVRERHSMCVSKVELKFCVKPKTCAPGFQRSEELGTCEPCQPGMFSTNEEERCQKCPPGTSSSLGASQCRLCPEGLYCPSYGTPRSEEKNCSYPKYICHEGSVNDMGQQLVNEPSIKSIIANTPAGQKPNKTLINDAWNLTPMKNNQVSFWSTSSSISATNNPEGIQYPKGACMLNSMVIWIENAITKEDIGSYTGNNPYKLKWCEEAGLSLDISKVGCTYLYDQGECLQSSYDPLPNPTGNASAISMGFDLNNPYIGGTNVFVVRPDIWEEGSSSPRARSKARALSYLNSGNTNTNQLGQLFSTCMTARIEEPFTSPSVSEVERNNCVKAMCQSAKNDPKTLSLELQASFGCAAPPPISPTKQETNNNGLLLEPWVISLISVLGFLTIVGIILGVMWQLRSEKKKKEDETLNSEGSKQKSHQRSMKNSQQSMIQPIQEKRSSAAATVTISPSSSTSPSLHIAKTSLSSSSKGSQQHTDRIIISPR
eukprot:g2626.t1